MDLAYLAQQLVNALQVSAVYGLLAVSYVLIHAITRRINLAFGAFAIWAGYTTVNTALWLMLRLPGETFLPIVLAGLLAVLHTTLAGAAIERTAIRPLLGHSSLAMLVATLGLAIAMEEAMRLSNDSRERWLKPVAATPIGLGGTEGFAVSATPIQLIVVALAALAAGLLVALVRRHAFGRLWRACSEDLLMAELTGVDVRRTLAITFALASATAAAAGVLLALSYGVATFHGGLVIGLKTLFVAITGGLTSVAGGFLGGLLLGLFETLWSGYLGPEYRDAAAFLALSALMVLFPHGLFGDGGRVDHV